MRLKILPYVFLAFVTQIVSTDTMAQVNSSRQRISINEGWKFYRYTSEPDKLIYDIRPEVTDRNDNIVADSKPTESVAVNSSEGVLKKWILPTANDFIKDPSKKHIRPDGDPGKDFPFVQKDFDDQNWEAVMLPHDWAIKGPFYKEANAIVGGGMGRLPIQGVAWYRKKIEFTSADKGKNIYLDIDGAMSYTMVWLNGHLLGGWPYGYNSFRLDLTSFLKEGKDNQLSIRLDNPTNSARWYPGGGIYRNVWLTKVSPVHIGQWGTFITAKNITPARATLDLSVEIKNSAASEQAAQVRTEVFLLDKNNKRTAIKAAVFPQLNAIIPKGEKLRIANSTTINKPLLWGPKPQQQPSLYVAVSRIYVAGKLMDEYETVFGIRSLDFDPIKGLLVNGQPIRMQGVNQHHDLGALGAAFNVRAAERQLEILRDMGCNAIRLSHNPPAPELLDLTDKMGFLVIDEVFDSWERKKTPLDFHLIFPDWSEPDTRSFIRRDRNHPSVIAWSYGNEVGEQYTADTGAIVSKRLYDIVKEEDSTRPATASMNYAKPDMPFPAVMDILSLNYQGEGIRDAPAYQHLRGIRTSPLYPAFQQKFPDKLIYSSETASTLSTRGTYVFPVFNGFSAPVGDSTGGDPKAEEVSAYELYTAAFGASPDKVFASQDKHPYVAGEFVWSGFDYLGEPTPYYSARSSYSGIVDLAGFKKDRFYLYQARWLPDLKMAHILPHWNWPDRVGKITPVHVFTSGDEGELFLDNISLGRKKKAAFEYRLRWDNVVYKPGTLRVVTYKNGKAWASDTVATTGAQAQLKLQADRSLIKADGQDLSFITLEVMDAKGLFVASSTARISFEVDGPAEIVATDNGDPADLESFASRERNAFSGMALVIIRAKSGAKGTVKVKASSPGLKPAELIIRLQ
jgi:beta-galactosidase